MKDENKIQELRKEIARIKEATACGEQLMQNLRKQLAGTERELAALTATLFVGVIYDPYYASYEHDAFGLVAGMEVTLDETRIRLTEDLEAVEIAIPGRKDMLVVYLKVGQEICFSHDLYREDDPDGRCEPHLGLHVRVFASLEEAGAWAEKM